MKNIFVAFALIVCLWGPIASCPAQESTDSSIIATAKVFILAGQSNMQGHGVVDLDHPEHYNGGKGTLVKLMELPDKKKMLAHLKSDDGKWTTRDDVWIRFQTPNQLKLGGLGIGFTGYENQKHHFGPELQFGHVLGDAFDEHVLLIKTAWGGKSLFEDFRPPSSGGEVGPYYKLMLEEIRTGLANAKTEFPDLADAKLDVSGFVWQQGWNDMVNDDAIDEYEQNLLNLIVDIRKELGKPDLPFVIGELGNGGTDVNQRMKRFRAAQAKIADHGDPNVRFVKTAAFARPADESPNKTHGHHWFGNAESYFLFGDALGYEMLKLIAPEKLTRVLLLGDSISMGYTRKVQQQLRKCFVTRPINAKGRMINCAGTTLGVKKIDEWLNSQGSNWDLIHFNFGLHDMKHVDAINRKNSMNPDDPLQASPQEYEKNLREIVTKLKSTNADLIFATTTPVPTDVKPLRETSSPAKYNSIARKIMQEHAIEINDLYEFALPQLNDIQQPNNVHFTKQGSQVLGDRVAEVIRKRLHSDLPAK